VKDSAAARPVTVSIAAVERDTGLSKDTLRVWERRYGFPNPERDAYGERAYSLEQIEKLRIIKRLLDSGHRPGRVVTMDIDALQTLGESLPTAPQRVASPEASDLRHYIDLIKSHDAQGLRRALQQAGMRMGVAALVCDVIAPLNVMVGDAWMRGQLEVFEEHMYTESVNVVLRRVISHAPVAETAAHPRVLLTTFPQEPHGLGLLMAEAMLCLEGCRCISLGTQTPIWDIVLAATAHRADIVALSFTAVQNPHLVLSGLEELRQKLPRAVALWVGGSGPVMSRKPLDGVMLLTELSSLGSAVAHWRARRG
jgi:MerR family transcriptional regulator, light-induced transcriptional regulator